MPGTPDFVNPPVVELVLGVQFSPLAKLTTGHFGLFWKHLGDEWTDPQDVPILDDQFEHFDGPKWSQPGLSLRLEQVKFPNRFMIGHRDKDRLVQIQATRFHFNWRKREGFYPSYRLLISQFEKMYEKFTAFVETTGLGKIIANQWELTYIDAFAQGDYWQTPADWSGFLPGLFGSLRTAEGLILEQRAAEWSYEIAPKKGRLHIAAQHGRWGENQQSAMLLQMTARGPVGKEGVETLREGLDIGHEAAVGTFLSVTSDEIKKRWS